MNDDQRLVAGCVMSAIGVVLAVVASEQLGTGILLVGVAVAVHGLHRLGRAGPDRWEFRA